MSLVFTRRNVLKFSASVIALYICRPLKAFAAIQEISGVISKGKKLSSDGKTSVEILHYSSEILKCNAKEPVVWTLENKTGADVLAHFQGVRAMLTVNGVRIQGVNFTLPASQKTRIEFMPKDAGSFLVQFTQKIKNLVISGALPIICEDKSPANTLKFENDMNICIYDQFDAANNAQYFVNLGKSTNFNFSQGGLQRFRLYNATQISLLPFIFKGGFVRVISIDGHAIEPYEPFQGRISLSPGQRADVVAFIPQNQLQDFLIDTKLGVNNYALFTAKITQTLREKIEFKPSLYTLPESGVPIYYDLAESEKFDWDTTKPQDKATAFTVKKGNTVVLTLENFEDKPVIVKFDAMVARPLDTLDDGVKPYVRDANFIKPKTKQKYAFIPEFEGDWTISISSLLPNAMPKVLTYKITA